MNGSLPETINMSNSNSLEKAQNKSPIVVARQSIENKIETHRLTLPQDYEYQNALNDAWLLIESTPNLKSCTQESKIQAMQHMVYRAFSPMKRQCYFVPYDGKVSCQPSYFGEVANAVRVQPYLQVYSDVIYEGEKFVPAKVWSNTGWITVVKEHELKWPRTGNIVGVYVGARDKETGEDLGIELMTDEQVKNSWKKSKTYSKDSKTFHNEQPDQAFLRTCSRRWAKPIINTSTDEYLLQAVRESDMDAIDAEVVEDHDQNANGEVLAIEQDQVHEAEMVEDKKAEPIKEEAKPRTPSAMDKVREAKEEAAKTTNQAEAPALIDESPEDWDE